jgi:hypothetical protein
VRRGRSTGCGARAQGCATAYEASDSALVSGAGRPSA